MTEKDIKLLWGRSGNLCAKCQIQITQDSSINNDSFTIGEQAHIIGESESAARGNSIISKQDRDGYSNRILLCPTCHTLVDKNEQDWPTEKLFILKTNHELYVQQTLAKTTDSRELASQAIIANISDLTVEQCKLRTWNVWTSHALSASPSWSSDFPDALIKFREGVLATVWPDGYDELRRSIVTISVLVSKCANTFLEHCEEHDGTLYPIKFYKSNGWNDNYHEDVKRYEAWLERCYCLIREATKAINWFADIVRRDINPMFFAMEGRFLITEGPFSDLSFRTRLVEFTEKENFKLPKSLFSK